MLAGVSGLCTRGVAVHPTEHAAQFKKRQLGLPGSQARIDPDLPAVKQRKALRFRSQVLILLTVFGWVALGNVLLMLWALVGDAPVCRWSLHRAPECTQLDVAALVGLLVGVASLYRVIAHFIVPFVRTPLFLLADEADEPCYIQNAGKVHTEMNEISAKRVGAVVLVIELVVSVVPLNPIWYLVTVVPAMQVSWAMAQAYFKV